MIAVVYVNIPSFFIFIVIYAINAIRNKILYGFYWKKEISIFFREEDQTLDWSIVAGVLMMSLCKFLGFCFVILTFNYAIAAGMNLGIVTVVFNFVCITDSIIFYFFFNERLTKGQLIGCLVLLCAAIFISLKPPSETLDPNL